MAGPWEAYQTRKEPTAKERATEANIVQSQASAGASQASAASSAATAEEKRALLPSRQRGAEALADYQEARAAQAKIALEKTQRLMSQLPKGEKAPEARALLLREIRNLAQAKDLSKTMFSASGIGYNMLSGWSGSPAATVDGLTAPVLADEAFKALSEMRANSPTGGALGNVTEKELSLLQSSGGFVPPTAGDEAFQQGLDDLIAKRIEVLNKLGVGPQELAEALGPDNAEQFAPMVRAYRFREEDAKALGTYIEKTMADGTYDPTDFAALMGQAYYNATGNEPDEGYAAAAFEIGLKPLAGEALGPKGNVWDYNTLDEQNRKQFLLETGVLKPEETGLGVALGGAALNFIPSTFELAFDTVKALTVDLPDTIEGAVKIIGGAVGLTDDAQYEAVKDYFGTRYGTGEGFRKALKTDPASIFADVVGVATGGGLLAAKTASTAAKITNIAKIADAAKAAEGFTRTVAKFDPLNIAAGTTKLGGKAVAGTTERIGAGVGRLVGAQPADLAQAVSAGKRGSPEFLAQLEGRAAPEDAITKADAALAELYASRSSDYTRRMDRVKKQPETLAFDDVEKAVEGVRNVGRHKGIDISGAGGVWDEVDAKMMEFFDKGLNSIEDFDAMKRAISNIGMKYQRGTPEYKVAMDVAKAVNNTITDKAPIYASVMKDYRLASDTLSDIKASISADAKSADTTLGKLRRSASDRGPRGRRVIDILESTKAGRGLGDLLAGQNLAAGEPSMLGTAAGTGATIVTGDPSAMAMSAMSAKGLGKGAYRFGELLGTAEKGRDALMQLPGVERTAELAAKYADPLATGIRVANPALIQPQVDPISLVQQPEEDLSAMLKAYKVLPPSMGAGVPDGGPSGVSLGDLQERYEGPTLGGFQPTYTDIDAAGNPVEAQTQTQTTQIINGRVADIDPVTGEMIYVDTGEVVEGYKRGGAVKGYKNGGPTFRDRARSVGQGVTFGFGDEIEGGVRALGSALSEGDLMNLRRKYLQERDMVRAQQKAYEDANPEAILYETGGAMLTGLIPGAQGATGARLAQLAARYPKLARAGSVAADTALYGAGTAESVRDIPRSIRDEALSAVPMYGAAEGVRAGVNRYRVRKGKKR
jgi:hypothetical protein